MRRFYLLGFLTLIIIFGISIYLIKPVTVNNREIKSTVKQFIEYLCAKNIEQAKELSIGKVHNALVQQENAPVLSATLQDVVVKVIASGNNIALVSVTADIQKTDGTYDVAWYNILLLKKKNGWKVTEVQPVSFLSGAISGRTGKLDTQPIDELKVIFTAYTNALAKNNWNKAGEYLVGQARTAHIMSKQILEKGRIIQKVKNLEMEPIWASKTDVIARASYNVDGRNVIVLIHFHRTAGGWRIAEINNIGGGGQ